MIKALHSVLLPRSYRIQTQFCTQSALSPLPGEHSGSRRLRVLGKKYIKRLLTVNTMYYMKPPKANLKVMDP